MAEKATAPIPEDSGVHPALEETWKKAAAKAFGELIKDHERIEDEHISRVMAAADVRARRASRHSVVKVVVGILAALLGTGYGAMEGFDRYYTAKVKAELEEEAKVTERKEHVDGAIVDLGKAVVGNRVLQVQQTQYLEKKIDGLADSVTKARDDEASPAPAVPKPDLMLKAEREAAQIEADSTKRAAIEELNLGDILKPETGSRK